MCDLACVWLQYAARWRLTAATLRACSPFCCQAAKRRVAEAARRRRQRQYEEEAAVAREEEERHRRCVVVQLCFLSPHLLDLAVAVECHLRVHPPSPAPQSLVLVQSMAGTSRSSASSEAPQQPGNALSRLGSDTNAGIAKVGTTGQGIELKCSAVVDNSAVINHHRSPSRRGRLPLVVVGCTVVIPVAMAETL